MRTFKLKTKLAAASLLLATAAFTAPSAFADDHYRGSDRGQVSHQQWSHSNDRNQSHDRGHDDNRRYDNRGHWQRQSWHDNRRHDRVVYVRQPVFYRGRSVPVGYRHAIQAVPAAYRYRVQAAPRGYRVGYYQGYSVVYDPSTFLILSVIDLLANN